MQKYVTYVYPADETSSTTSNQWQISVIWL